MASVELFDECSDGFPFRVMRETEGDVVFLEIISDEIGFDSVDVRNDAFSACKIITH